jgi:hypothetical protein
MDKDDIIRQLDRQLRIRAMFAFERKKMGPQELEREFAKSALDLVRRQPVMAEELGMPLELLEGDPAHQA